MSLYTEAMPDDPSIVAFLYGPLVLAGDLGKEGLEKDKRYGPMAPKMDKISKLEMPVFRCSTQEVLAKLIHAPGTTTSFCTVGAGTPGDLLLVPFYKVNEPRYTVYWRLQPSAEQDTEKNPDNTH
jgi:hypothetical protein